MADRSPARALAVVKRIVEMCDFIEHPAIREAIEQKMVPVTMPRVVNAVVDISVWSGSERSAFGLPLMRLPIERVFRSQIAPAAVGRPAFGHGSPLILLKAMKVGASKS
jgi:hypothetical protein